MPRDATCSAPAAWRQGRRAPFCKGSPSCEAQSRARIAEEKVAALTEENDRLADKNMHLRAQNDRLAAAIARLSGENGRLANQIARLRASSASDAARARS